MTSQTSVHVAPRRYNHRAAAPCCTASHSAASHRMKAAPISRGPSYFQSVTHLFRVAHQLPIEGMNITSAQLQDISFQICRGNAAFGLLLANRYLPQSSPLRRALATKAKERLPESVVKNSRLASALLDGSSATEMPANWSVIIGAKASRPKIKSVPNFTVRDFSKRGVRYPKRTRAHRTRFSMSVERAA